MGVAHANVKSLASSQVEALIAWAGGAGAPEDAGSLLSECRGPDTSALWLLAHCDDGVTWGRCDGSRLLLSCSQHENWPTPRPTARNLQQLRLFGERGEVLVWRREDAGDALAGRLLADGAEQPHPDDPARPCEELYLVLGTRIAEGGEATGDGFTAVTDAAGRVQVLPLGLGRDTPDWGRPAACLRISHYLERDEETGCVRIAASRLVALEPVPEEREKQK
ncbi:MAG: type III-D CRISPR-associated protein Csx19 [Actinomycetota bacterium]